MKRQVLQMRREGAEGSHQAVSGECLEHRSGQEPLQLAQRLENLPIARLEILWPIEVVEKEVDRRPKARLGPQVLVGPGEPRGLVGGQCPCPGRQVRIGRDARAGRPVAIDQAAQAGAGAGAIAGVFGQRVPGSPRTR